MAPMEMRPGLDPPARAKERQGDFRSFFSHVLRCSDLQLSRPWQGADDFLESVPLRRCPDFGLRVAEGSNQSRHFGRRFDFVCNKDIKVIAGPEHGIAVEPLDVRALFPYALHDVPLELLK